MSAENCRKDVKSIESFGFMVRKQRLLTTSTTPSRVNDIHQNNRTFSFLLPLKFYKNIQDLRLVGDL